MPKNLTDKERRELDRLWRWLFVWADASGLETKTKRRATKKENPDGR